MEIADYLKLLRRRGWLVALTVAVGVAGAAVVDALTPIRYQATTRLLIAGASSEGIEAEGIEAEGASRQLAVARAVAYAQLIQTGPGLTIAARTARVLDQHPAVTAEATRGTPFITVTAEADTPEAVRALADAYRVAVPRIVEVLEHAPVSALPVITVLEAPALPGRPSAPRPLRDVPIGVVLGLVLGLGAAMLREALDGRLREAAQLERVAEAPLLGAVPREHGRRSLPALQLPRSARAEVYRHVRTNLEFSGPAGMPRSVAVTSASPQEGKSTLTANLAIAAAHGGRRVVVVDADLRKPSLARYFGARPDVGLADVLAGTRGLDDVLVPVEGTRAVLLPSGTTPSFPSELVGSAAMVDLIDELERRFDLVVIDTTPVLPVSDALSVGVHVDSVVVVARMGETTRASLNGRSTPCGRWTPSCSVSSRMPWCGTRRRPTAAGTDTARRPRSLLRSRWTWSPRRLHGGTRPGSLPRKPDGVRGVTHCARVNARCRLEC